MRVNLDERLSRVLDRIAVLQVKSRLAESEDARRWAQVEATSLLGCYFAALKFDRPHVHNDVVVRWRNELDLIHRDLWAAEVRGHSAEIRRRNIQRRQLMAEIDRACGEAPEPYELKEVDHASAN